MASCSFHSSLLASKMLVRFGSYLKGPLSTSLMAPDSNSFFSFVSRKVSLGLFGDGDKRPCIKPLAFFEIFKSVPDPDHIFGHTSFAVIVIDNIRDMPVQLFRGVFFMMPCSAFFRNRVTKRCEHSLSLVCSTAIEAFRILEAAFF